ncbi:hypothetical protein PORY_001619 [Pneumocystis oryctolagi]|uniref:Uncharacterized protein n=1 Tax=Pneumocystis oryctolagi TaxID=42067 RepID=A0ACB7CB39_9ASCO|nr:hypothetical protein PORY_001619 [Pneumocystis oryctolagi]
MESETEEISYLWIKDFFKTKDFPKVPETPLIKYYKSENLLDIQSSKKDTSTQSLSNIPSSYQILKNEYVYEDSLNNSSKESIKYEEKSISSISLENTEHISLSNKNQNLQDYSLENEDSEDKSIKSDRKSLLDFSNQEKSSFVKAKGSETCDIITLISYIQKELIGFLKNIENDKYMVSYSENVHDIAKLKYQKTHGMRKIIRSLSLIKLHILSSYNNE